jgi:hypothetical protein
MVWMRPEPRLGVTRTHAYDQGHPLGRGGDLAVVAPPRGLRVMVSVLRLNVSPTLAATTRHAAEGARSHEPADPFGPAAREPR